MARKFLLSCAALAMLGACEQAIQREFADDKAICTEHADKAFKQSKAKSVKSKSASVADKASDTKKLLYHFYLCMNRNGWQVAVPDLEDGIE